MSRRRPYTHKFGTVIPDDRPYLAAEVAPMIFPRKDGKPGHWEIEEVPAGVIIDGRTVVDPASKGLVRHDSRQLLSITSDTYEPLRIADTFAALDPWVKEGVIRYDVGGAYHYGKRVWLLAAVNVEPIEVAPGDEIDPYILIANTYDRSGSIIVKPTAERRTCSNALRAMMLDGIASIRVRHSGDVAGKLSAAVQSIGAIRQACERQRRVYQAMVDKPATVDDLACYVAAIWQRPIAEIIGDPAKDIAPARALGPILDAWDNPRGGRMGTTTNTVFGAYQAATQALTHGSATSTRTAEARSESLMFNGDAAKLDRAEVVADLLATIGIRKSSGWTWEDVIAAPTSAIRHAVDDARPSLRA